MVSSGTSRERRLAERIRADLSDLLVRGAVRDPDVAGAIVTDVKVSGDLGVARVYLRLLTPEPDPARRERLLAAMKRAGGFLRRELGASLAVRRVPELRFQWDEAADRAARLEAIFEEIRRARTDPARDEEA